jgi:hypothetical protein
MIMGLLEKIFGSYADKELKRINPIVDKIESLEPESLRKGLPMEKHSMTFFLKHLRWYARLR